MPRLISVARVAVVASLVALGVGCRSKASAGGSDSSTTIAPAVAVSPNEASSLAAGPGDATATGGGSANPVPAQADAVVELPAAKVAERPVTRLTYPNGTLVSGTVTPDELSIAWDGKQGIVTNSYLSTLVDDVEGDSNRHQAHVASLDATGRGVVPWHSAVDRERARALKAAMGGSDLPRDYFETRATAFVDVDGPTYASASQAYSGGASHSCLGGGWFVGTTTSERIALDGCAVEPILHGGSRGNRQALWAFGIDYVAYNGYMDRANKSETPFQEARPAPVGFLFVREGVAKWRRITGTPARAAGAVAVGATSIGIVGREPIEIDRTAKAVVPKTAPGDRALALVVAPWDGSASARYELDRGDVGEPTVTWQKDRYIVVYARRENAKNAYRLYVAYLPASGAVTKAGPFGPPNAVAPALAAAGDALALAFMEETKPSRVRFACGAVDVSALAAEAEIVSEAAVRSRDPELALAPDGSTGAIAFHAFPARSSGVRTSAFTCTP